LERASGPASPEQVAGVAADLLHEDYAYVFGRFGLVVSSRGWWEMVECHCWCGSSRRSAIRRKSRRRNGHIQIDLVWMRLFCNEELALTRRREHVRNNVHSWSFTSARRKKAGATDACSVGVGRDLGAELMRGCRGQLSTTEDTGEPPPKLRVPSAVLFVSSVRLAPLRCRGLSGARAPSAFGR